MAVGVEFLSKTRLGGMKDIMSSSNVKQANPNQGSGNLSALLANNKSQNAAKKADVGSMNTSDLLKYVYGNGFKNNDIKLPANVDFNGQKFDTNGKKFDDVVKDICKQTGESKARVETELKKKYISAGGASGQKGTSLNMQA